MNRRGSILTSQGRALTSISCRAGSADGGGGGGKDKKKETKLGLAHRKADEFGEWYSEVVVESEMISYYDVSGGLCVPEGLLVWQPLCGGLHSHRCCTVIVSKADEDLP